YASELSSTNFSYDVEARDVPTVTAGTPNIASFQIQGGPLYGLVNPQRIQWKLAGQDPSYYQLLEGPKDVNPDLIPQNFLSCWELRNYIIVSTLATGDVDLQ